MDQRRSNSLKFAFLRKDFPRIERPAREAEKFASQSPTVSCWRARSALEHILVECYRRNHGAQPPRSYGIYELLQDSDFQRCAATVHSHCLEIKRLGDPAAHRVEMSRNDAERSIELLGIVAEWFYYVFLSNPAPREEADPAAESSDDVGHEIRALLAKSPHKPGTIGYRLLEAKLLSERGRSHPSPPVREFSEATLQEIEEQAIHTLSSLKQGMILKAMVIDRVRGGLVLDVGVRGFLPSIEIGKFDNSDRIERYVGSMLEVVIRVVDVDMKKVLLGLDREPL